MGRIEIENRSNDRNSGLCTVSLHHAVQPILGTEHRGNLLVVGHDPGPGDRPRSNPFLSQIVQIYGEVSTVKRPHPQMHDPSAEPGPVVGRKTYTSGAGDQGG